jgi:hypothetical protein
MRWVFREANARNQRFLTDHSKLSGDIPEHRRHDDIVRSQLHHFGAGRSTGRETDPGRLCKPSQGDSMRAGSRCGNAEHRAKRPGRRGGIAVHIGARISALAGPNEVLVSQTVRDAVIGSGITFDDRGTHELKGVPGQWRLYDVAS